MALSPRIQALDISSHLGWIREVFSLEIRRAFAYRANFWLQFLAGTGSHLLISYWLWKAVFSSTGDQRIGGYSFAGMVLYTIIATSTQRIMYGEEFLRMTDDIYSGAYSRYLVYPISFLGYKLTIAYAQGALALQQLVAGIILFRFFLPFPSDLHMSAGWGLAYLLAVTVGLWVQFSIAICIESAAFWVENVWTLSVMMRFIISLLGGALLPLTLFPPWAHAALGVLPFSYLAGFPTRVLLGELRISEFVSGLVMAAAWGAALNSLAVYIMRRGQRRYTGVGM